jgi:L,D-peptidoglycan transpeptidase YkuD (ErfK/YbiS/YcfS/YnhG family)
MRRSAALALFSVPLVGLLAGAVVLSGAPGVPTASRLESVLSSSTKTLPEQLAATGGGTQLITAVTTGTTNASRSGTLTWWSRTSTKSKKWTKVGSTPARFGKNGLSNNRLEGDGTTPTGLFRLPSAFGIKADPGTKMVWNSVTANSWWDENSKSARYNTWYQNCPATICWTSATQSARSSEHLASYTPQYNYGVFIGFNADKVKVLPPKRPSGSGIFLHVFGSGYTAGCVSVKRAAMVSLLKWLDPAKAPHIVIGNSSNVYKF